MKGSPVLVCTLSLVAMSGIACAQTSGAAAQNGRLVTVSFNAAVLQTAEAKQGFGALDAKYAPRQAQLQSLTNEVEGLRRELSDTKLSDADRASRQRELDEKDKQLQRQTEDFRSDSQADSQQVYEGVARKMYTFLQGYAQRSGFGLVIDRGSEETPVVWYTAGGVDITDDLIKAYNAQADSSPGGAKGTAAPSPQQPLPSAPTPHP
jgi:Skp family chaperone for outer membrane proteins